MDSSSPPDESSTRRPLLLPIVRTRARCLSIVRLSRPPVQTQIRRADPDVSPAGDSLGKVLRVGILASGEGTNFQALHDACVTGYARAEIVVVLSNRRPAGVLQRAAHAGVEGVFVDPADTSSREEYDRLLL